MSETTDYHPLYLGGIQHFNACYFYEAHEVWEALWTEYRGPARLFYQGLIQAAVGLHHFGNGNIRVRVNCITVSASIWNRMEPHTWA